MEESQPYKQQCQPFSIDGIFYYTNKRYRSHSPINNHKLKKTKYSEHSEPKGNLKKKKEVNNPIESKKIRIK